MFLCHISEKIIQVRASDTYRCACCFLKNLLTSSKDIHDCAIGFEGLCKHQANTCIVMSIFGLRMVLRTCPSPCYNSNEAFDTE